MHASCYISRYYATYSMHTSCYICIHHATSPDIMLHCMASCYISRHLASQYSHLKNKIEMKIFVILLIPLFAPPYVYPPHPLDDFSLPFSSDSIEEFILPALNSLIVNHPTSNSSFASCYVERFYKIMKQQH